jgi:chromate transporter
MALGYARAGWVGLAIAGGCFIVPASLATLGLAWAYVHYGHMPQAQGLLYGTKPVMVAIVVQAIWRLGRLALRGWFLLLAGLGCFAAALAGVAPIALLLTAGGVAALVANRGLIRVRGAQAFAVLPAAGAGGVTATTGTVGLLPLVLIFVKLGVVIFGSGYVLLAFMQRDLVDRLHWVTQAQLLDAVTAGQVTPGPVFATATFLGYLLHGYAGAAAATTAIFAPSFLMAGAVGAFAERIRRSKLAASFLDGVNAAAVALMAAVALELGRATLVDGWTWALGLLSVVALVRFRLNATWLIVGGAVVGILLRALQG